MTVLQGKEIASAMYEDFKKKIASLTIKPCLAVMLVGDNEASKIYVNIKKKACARLGIISQVHKLAENISLQELLDRIRTLNNNDSVHGILVQLPLPYHLDAQIVLASIHPDKDVDCLTPVNLGRLFDDESDLAPCTPKGIMRLLEETGDLSGKHAVIVGRSKLVGKSLAHLLLRKDATVTICHSKTRNLAQHTTSAEIVVAAAGKSNLITADMIREGAIVIDVGINKVEANIVGDVDFRNVEGKASYITPVPGGVGPMTVAMLMQNTLLCYEKVRKYVK